MDRSRLVTVIPAHNEAATIGAVVSAAMAHCEVIVVDDGSVDATACLAAASGARIVANRPARGYEGALEAGFAEAARCGFAHVVTMDADGEHDPATIPQFIELHLGQNMPLVLGYRRESARCAEAVTNAYFRLRYGVNDMLCGMKGYHLDLWREYGGFDRTKGVGTELAAFALRTGAAFGQVAVDGVAREDAPRYGASLKANLRIARALGQAVRRDLGASI